MCCIASHRDAPATVVPFQARPVAQLDLSNQRIIGHGQNRSPEWLGEVAGPALHIRESLGGGRWDIISAGGVSEPPGYGELDGVIVAARGVGHWRIDYCEL